MDPITAAIVTALSTGAISGLTETSKTAIADAYTQLKDLLTKKFGDRSNVMQAIEDLEARPALADRKEILQEKIVAVQAEQDEDFLAAAQRLMALVQLQLAHSTLLEHAWLVPYDHNEFFTGREGLLKRLHDTLPAVKTGVLTPLVAISGLGGIGKTQTAIEETIKLSSGPELRPEICLPPILLPWQDCSTFLKKM